MTSILVDPNSDPHQFEADARTAAAVSKSQLVIENGLGYDDFMDKLLLASPNANRHVVNAAEVMKISGDDANPHIWYDIAKIPDVAMAISTELTKLDPTDAATFTANTKAVHGQSGPDQRRDRQHQGQLPRRPGRLHRTRPWLPRRRGGPEAGDAGLLRPIHRRRQRSERRRQLRHGRGTDRKGHQSPALQRPGDQPGHRCGQATRPAKPCARRRSHRDTAADRPELPVLATTSGQRTHRRTSDN